MSAPAVTRPSVLHEVTRGRVRNASRRRLVALVLAVLVVAAFAVTLMAGQTFYPPRDVVRVILGEQVPGASFTVGRLRLPRAVLAVTAGFSFGMAGVTFQTMLRNPLASPDVIGISSGASAAAAIAIVSLSLGETQVSVLAIVAALVVALLVYTLAFRDGVVGTRLILIGIGISAMLDSITSYVLSRAAEWDLQEATRWLTGSLNGVGWDQTVPAVIALAVLTPVLLSQGRNLSALRLGDDTASALGVRVERTRITVIVAAVGLIAFATAAAGPIAFVAFLSGPIAARIVGAGGSLLVPAGLVGSLLVLVADFAGQFAFDTRYPVGVVTGVLGAPYLVHLIVRTHRAGGSI
ncbi:iron chelate uptake ABC transporter family permease subunit [Streptomyces sp. NE06-03E]|uniref:FecCD family ABC transporter permease n=1 Tax=unclassified Streptomyces TaxID=2593676 RepID=UPI0029A1C729|nr:MULTISPECIES: iron chelate uptake ABC transporter family permease subunit [unclassified Streptomyces]MDX3057647.1 iron chelate uptake ABC transporter family permease subunit [Streptomyces sp. NE06-03E]MDX3683885.1 iron chelate uptake ABC transporter family permease subunit [Streptomyces sp. AK04-4c]WSS72043.1 iron chelate uptake ABC transporter family permease subunit [Streptomyces sp. NBC_01175]